MRTALSCFAALIAPLVLAAAEPAHARSFQQEIAADPRGEVDVSNFSGSIEVTGWDRPQVAVSADLTSDAQRVEVRSEHGRTSIRVSGPVHPWLGGSEARLQVSVPRESEINLYGVSVDITSRGVGGAQHLDTVSGRVDADLGSGDDDVKSVSGDLRLRGSGRPGFLHVSSVSGDVSIRNAAGDVEATTVSGGIDVELAMGRSVRLRTTSGELELTTPLERGAVLETETLSGDQRIKAKAEAGYEYEVRTFSGEIENCFGQRAERMSEYGPGKRLDGTRGAGSGRIRLRSLSGSVSLCDH